MARPAFGDVELEASPKHRAILSVFEAQPGEWLTMPAIRGRLAWLRDSVEVPEIANPELLKCLGRLTRAGILARKGDRRHYAWRAGGPSMWDRLARARHLRLLSKDLAGEGTVAYRSSGDIVIHGIPRRSSLPRPPTDARAMAPERVLEFDRAVRSLREAAVRLAELIHQQDSEFDDAERRLRDLRERYVGTLLDLGRAGSRPPPERPAVLTRLVSRAAAIEREMSALDRVLGRRLLGITVLAPYWADPLARRAEDLQQAALQDLGERHGGKPFHLNVMESRAFLWGMWLQDPAAVADLVRGSRGQPRAARRTS